MGKGFNKRKNERHNQTGNKTEFTALRLRARVRVPKWRRYLAEAGIPLYVRKNCPRSRNRRSERTKEREFLRGI